MSVTLFAAVCEEQWQVVELLVNSGISIDSRNENGESSIMIARRNGKEETVKKLLSFGAESAVLSPHLIAKDDAMQEHEYLKRDEKSSVSSAPTDLLKSASNHADAVKAKVTARSATPKAGNIPRSSLCANPTALEQERKHKLMMISRKTYFTCEAKERAIAAAIAATEPKHPIAKPQQNSSQQKRKLHVADEEPAKRRSSFPTSTGCIVSNKTKMQSSLQMQKQAMSMCGEIAALSTSIHCGGSSRALSGRVKPIAPSPVPGPAHTVILPEQPSALPEATSTTARQAVGYGSSGAPAEECRASEQPVVPVQVQEPKQKEEAGEKTDHGAPAAAVIAAHATPSSSGSSNSSSSSSGGALQEEEAELYWSSPARQMPPLTRAAAARARKNKA